MRVLQLVTQLEPGGAQRVARVLDLELRARGHEVTTEFVYFKRPMEDWGPERCWFRGRPSTRDASKLARQLRGRPGDVGAEVVLTHTHFANALTRLIPASVPCVAVHHGPRSTHGLAAKWTERAASETRRFAANVAVSPAVERELRQERFANVKLIPNPGPPLDHKPDSWDVQTAPSIACIGRLAPQKNQRALLEAIPLMSEAIGTTVIYGEGPLRGALASQADELGLGSKLHLAGDLPNEALLARLRTDRPIYVAASTWEAMPMSLLEVAGCGLPIVASDIEAHRWLLGDNAVYFDPANPGALAGSVRQVIDDRVLANERAQRLYAHLSAEFRLEAIVDRYAETLEAVVNA